MTSPLSKAIEFAGSQTALAKALSQITGEKLRQSHISTWLYKNKKGVPAEYCAAIEHITGGRVTRSDLRPDIWPPETSDNNPTIISPNSTILNKCKDQLIVNKKKSVVNKQPPNQMEVRG
jgi:DNA-binding transcriptional regulator YdaS (Cro superfamily)